MGCDVIAPSDMMDGRIGEIRNELDIKAYPTYVIIDNGTKIEKIFNSFEDVEDYLSK